jgi:SAM-dependent methyltransferase
MEKKGENPKKYWDQQHSQRNIFGLEGTILRDIPTPTGKYLISLIPPSSRILEIGSANGRDARYWSQNGHRVDCIDFSKVALNNLEELAQKQGVIDNIAIHLFDISEGSLPLTLPKEILYNAFFARSSLSTINDECLDVLLQSITKKLLPDGIIIIEGRSINDPKIKRSSIVSNNIVDDKGHQRRVYTVDNMTILSKKNGWEIEEISEHIETGFETPLHLLRLVARAKK